MVLDVGGAAGAYALWLAGLGYSVHLRDPVSRLVSATRAVWMCPGDTADIVLLISWRSPAGLRERGRRRTEARAASP